MKSPALLVALVAAVIGGVVGAVVVSLLNPTTQAPAQGGVVADSQVYNDTGLRAEQQRNRNELDAMRLEIDALTTELESAKRQRQQLETKNDALNTKLDSLEGAEISSALSTTDSQPDPSGVVDKADVDKAVQDALEKAQQEKREKAIAAKQRETEKWINDGRDRVLKKLAAELSLTSSQHDGITTVFEQFNERMQDLTLTAVAAQDAGEKFDYRAEWDALVLETNTAIRNELGSAQLGTYDELVGERGFASLAWPGK